MERNVCQQIKEVKGSKSTKIMELINNKLQDAKEKMLPKHIKDEAFLRLEKIYLHAEAEKILAKSNLDKRKKELGIEWAYLGSDKYGYRILNRCRISQEDYDILQKAQDLFSIGKR